MDVLESIRFVLINTSHAGNIGGSARAMKVMGLRQLHLVGPEQYPSAEATARASGADDVLYHAQVHDGLSQAIEPCTLVMGTSARNRGMDIPVVDLETAVKLMLERSATDQVALLFGKERYGLTNPEMQRCQYLVKFPANPEYGSLNLAAAVQVAAYEIRKQALAQQTDEPVGTGRQTVSSGALESYYEHLFQVMNEVDFMSENNRKSLEEKLRMMYNRLEFQPHEIDIMRGFLSAIRKNLKK